MRSATSPPSYQKHEWIQNDVTRGARLGANDPGTMVRAAVHSAEGEQDPGRAHQLIRLHRLQKALKVGEQMPGAEGLGFTPVVATCRR